MDVLEYDFLSDLAEPVLEAILDARPYRRNERASDSRCDEPSNNADPAATYLQRHRVRVEEYSSSEDDCPPPPQRFCYHFVIACADSPTRGAGLD